MKSYPLLAVLIALPFLGIGLYLTAGFCFPGILPFATFVGFGPALLSLLIGFVVWKRRQREA
jgi:uncharacterized membrane protein